MRFADRVAIVTGAASGIGLLTAQELAREGAKAALADVNGEAAAAAAEEIRAAGGSAIGVPVDVRRYEQVTAAVDCVVEEYGRVDIMINCAGGSAKRVHGRSEPFHELPIEIIDWGIDVNFRGPLYFCHAVFGHMIEQKGGVVVNLGSVTGLTGGHDMEYAAAKSGMLGLTRSLAIAGGPHGIRACCVSPGPVLTRPEMAKLKTRLGRAAQPEEVTKLILYLCSDDAAFITGANYTIDGGRSVGAM